ncbi:MAG: hypothetical protein R2739_00515 [Chitinophagales bacterium]|nr:hypothetical protein [Bacteroidota bacterium]
MNTIRKYYQQGLPILGMLLAYWISHYLIFFILSVVLLLLLLFVPKVSKQVHSFLERILNIAGTWIKTSLFALLFIVLIIPLSFFLKRQDKNVSFVQRNHSFEPEDFKKMW